MDLYRSLGLDVVDLTDEFTRAATGEPVAERFYRVRDSGSVGHLNPAGHAVAARAISRALSLQVPASDT